MVNKILLLSYIIYSFYKFKFSNCLTCKDDNNEEVDWFAVYKFPKIHNSQNSLIKSGEAYTYVTSKNYNQWTLSKHSINESNSIFANNLGPFYSNKNSTHIFYNDQPPNEPIKDSKGHTKGIILTDSESGLWLIHSVPHFPTITPKYEFSKSGILKGQSFLCISLDLENLNRAGIQLQYNEPQIFSSFINENLTVKLTNLLDTINGKVVQEPPWYNKLIITSKNGVQFTSFAKSKKFGKDLYLDWIAPTLQADLWVETWLNGPGRLPSDCSKPFKVRNIESVSINAAQVTFNDSEDHSKWAVSSNSWICIGDINRMEHQKVRGGGSMCTQNEKLAKNYKDAIKLTENCK